MTSLINTECYTTTASINSCFISYPFPRRFIPRTRPRAREGSGCKAEPEPTNEACCKARRSEEEGLQRRRRALLGCEVVEETGVEPVSRNLRPQRLQACPVYLSLAPSPTHRQERSTGPARFDLAYGPPGEVLSASLTSRRPGSPRQAGKAGRSRVLSRESVIGVGDYFFSPVFLRGSEETSACCHDLNCPGRNRFSPDRA